MSAFLLRQAPFPALPLPERLTSPFTEVKTAVARYLWTNPILPRREDIEPNDETESTELPPTAKLLTDGGDMRIVCDAKGANRYGCSSTPQPRVLAYGSSTASTVSVAGFAAADALRDRLNSALRTEARSAIYAREMDRLRADLIANCGLEDLHGLDLIFGASGTDLHLFASQLMVEPCAVAPLILRVESAETGRGVPDALAGRHFSDCAALGDAVVSNAPLDCGREIEIVEVKCRDGEGTLRSGADVDREISATVMRAASLGRRVLLTLVDVSKTGFIAPSPSCALALKRCFPNLVEVLVDACQFRLATETLHAYLEADFIVAMTGSKFITGPTFCGALMVPKNAAARLRSRTLPQALKSYSASADWPTGWSARCVLNDVPNFGLLLRWEAALTELRAFRQFPEKAVAAFITIFAKAVTDHLADHPTFALQSLPNLNRGSIGSVQSWDRLPTIFSFVLRKNAATGQRAWLDRAETKKVHELLRDGGCQLGQPVESGSRNGTPVSALRLCLSSRQIVDALAPTGRGAAAIIAEALAVLDQTALAAARV
jgi:hypothetical protein